MSDSPTSLRVLFVEDEADLRRAYGRFFGNRYELAFAATGAEALSVAEAFLPDLVVLDMRLPDTDGIEVLRALRLTHPKLRAVITSAYSSMEPLVEVLGLEYDRYLIKPFALNDLEAAIDAAGRA